MELDRLDHIGVAEHSSERSVPPCREKLGAAAVTRRVRGRFSIAAIASLLAAATPAGNVAAMPQPLSTGPIAMIDGTSADTLAGDAFRDAFGSDGEVRVRREGRIYDFRPIAAIELGGGRIALVSAGTLRDAAHSEGGVNAIHYLEPRRGRWRVIAHWFEVGAEGSFGQPASRWGVTREIGDWPVLYTEGGGTWQGCTTSWASLTELRPEGPREVAAFHVYYSDVGTGWEDSGREIGGEVVSAEPGRFTVRYDGTEEFSESYVRDGTAFRLADGDESRLPRC